MKAESVPRNFLLGTVFILLISAFTGSAAVLIQQRIDEEYLAQSSLAAVSSGASLTMIFAFLMMFGYGLVWSQEEYVRRKRRQRWLTRPRVASVLISGFAALMMSTLNLQFAALIEPDLHPYRNAAMAGALDQEQALVWYGLL